MIKIKKMFKIHGLRTAQGLRSGDNNSCFYETEEEAILRATEYVQRSPSVGSMVIYKAYCLVRSDHPPVEVLFLEHNGEGFELGPRSEDTP